MKTLIPDWTLDDDDKSSKEYFQKAKKSYTEDTMIDILKEQSDRYSLYWAILALRNIGTVKSIKFFKNVVHYKNMDVQGTCVLTIAKLANGMENEFLGKLLLDKDFKQKWYTMVAIFFKVDKKPLPYILEYRGKA